ncbi:hypothetical protein NECAME_00125 [Necator americanus]|uniref:Uncharacterized protein n=1 Tax=Necator americanus TaxID=51031 RepID=W2U1N3_NECAM|nr:hypothetical protein NECAME_00125 [Necator americanus]ETN87266.1 hypothetical protein NECAME_00125 [Necator americanus]
MLLKISFLIIVIFGEPVFKRQGLQEILSSIDIADKAFLRTAAIIEQRSEYGRLVLLLCRRNCPRLRSLIPQWVRDINEDKQYHGSETIGYHYYTYKKPLPSINESRIEQFPALVYFIAQTPTYFTGNITSRVWELIEILLPNATEECPPLHDTMWNSVETPLTELQLIYLSGEHDLVKLEHKQSYVLVGLTGGIAVIALAMSIFWGLNGSAFAN